MRISYLLTRCFLRAYTLFSSALMIKKLRYYARFTVVCLLLNNRDIISTLKDELAALVSEYITIYRPTDAAEWQLVLQEVSSFTDVSGPGREKPLQLGTRLVEELWLILILSCACCLPGGEKITSSQRQWGIFTSREAPSDECGHFCCPGQGRVFIHKDEVAGGHSCRKLS